MSQDESEGSSRASPNLPRVIELMEEVYGSFTVIQHPHLWAPPPMDGAGHRGRYLWTDAFGVLNFLTIYKESGQEKYLTLAIRLIEAVHDILGRDRGGKDRLPRATEDNPLAGGLRIGKVDETGPDGDGQYMHYLVLWMYALNRTTLASRDRRWNEMGMQLARAVCPWFWRNPDNHREGTYWKISWDMYRPLTPSEGYLDPLDCFMVFSHLQATADAYGTNLSLHSLIDDFACLARNRRINRQCRDPLDLGMGLWVAHWLARYEGWAYSLLHYNSKNLLRVMDIEDDDDDDEMSMSRRVAFREMGACMGIKTIDETLLTERDMKAMLIIMVREVMSYWETRMDARVPANLKTITLNMMASAYIPDAWTHGYFGEEEFDDWMKAYQQGNPPQEDY